MAMKVGDRVTVYRKVNVNYWVKYMDKFVGQSGVIIGFVPSDSAVCVRMDTHKSGEYYIPKSALKYEEVK